MRYATLPEKMIPPAPLYDPREFRLEYHIRLLAIIEATTARQADVPVETGFLS